MLDPDHPMSKYISAAAYADGDILENAKRITRSARQDRLQVRDGCIPAFAELRRLARDHFADQPAILPAIDELEQALGRLVDLPGVPEKGSPAEHTCPACGTALDHRKYGFPSLNNPTDIYCSPCLDIIMPALCELRSCDGFRTDAI